MADDEHCPEDGTPEEKKPINSVDGGGNQGDGEAVRVRRPPKNAGCYLTRIQAGLLALFVLLIAVGVGVVCFILARPDCDCPEESGLMGWTNLGPSTPRPTVDPVLPWAGIRLPRSVIPSTYDLELKVDLSHFNFSGKVSIDVNVETKTEYIILHSNSLTIRKSTVSVIDIKSGKSVSIYNQISVPINDYYVLQMTRKLKANRLYRINIGYFTGLLEDDLRGLYKSMYKDEDGNKRWLAASQLQSIDARKVFPCFDEPDLKANFTVALIHKKDFIGLSNMPERKQTVLENNWVKDEFETTPVMSTYLLAFVIADFRHREQTDGNLTIRIWAQPDMYDQTAYALEFAILAYNFFDGYFGTPEVVPKADHCAIPDFSAGAMENWGLVLYRETALLHDEEISSISNKYWVSLVMAHEIAHTWFGNMVTMRWWDDLWLNEGFANTLMYFALDIIYPDWNVFDLQLVNNVYSVMTKDSLLTSHAISTPIIHPDDITQFFDSISYDKGMAVLRLLRGFLGWNDFQTGLQMYISNYKYGNAEMSQLWHTFEKAVNSKYKVSEIMDTWTRQMGFPVVTVRHINGGRYHLEQTRFLLNPDDKFEKSTSPYQYKWRIPFIYKVQGNDTEHSTWMNLGSAEINVAEGKWLIGNVDYMGFYRTNYDDSMWRKLIDQLNKDHTVFSAANRAGLISDAFNLARASKLNYEIAFNLTSYLHKEADYVPWRAFLDSIDFIKGMLATSNAYGVLQKYIFNLVAPQHRRVGTSDKGDLLERNLRRSMLEAASGVGVPDAIDWAKRGFVSWMDYGSKIQPDYAVVIYAIGIQQGGEKEWNYLWTKAQSTRVASEAEIMMNALAYTQQPWLLWRYARWSLDSSKIRMQDVRNLFRYFASTPLGRTVALQFLLTNWVEINKRFGMDAYLLRDIIYATTSLINTEYEYKQLHQLYSNYPPAGVASKSAENSLALIRSNVKWLKNNHDTITRWLEKNVPV